MNNDDEIISGFNSKDEPTPFAIDFSTAKRLDRAGATCDAYESTVQRRHLFIKRLKPEYRHNPLYRAAFEKEYELGVGLNHVSLPRYEGYGDDYIVMDFIEGDTLADLLGSDDRRLRSRRFVGKMLGELVDVVEYLHRRHVVHCDIKPDNIIISPHSDRPLTLIDLDKAYTSWLATTHGNTHRYGCDDCADGLIDFKGIGMIADKLGMKGVARACFKDDATADTVRAALGRGRRWWRWLVAGIAAALCTWLVVAYLHRDGPAPEAVVAEAAAPDTVIIQEAPPAVPPIDKAWISSLIAEKARQITGYRATLWAILDCDTIAVAKKRDAITDYIYSYGMAHSAIIYSAVTHHSDVDEMDVQRAVRDDPAWVRLEEEEEDLQRRLRQWEATVSQRSSSRPASLPDTTPDVS